MKQETERVLALRNAIQKSHTGLAARRSSLRETVQRYHERWMRLVIRELRSRRMTWCTYCSDVILKRRSSLMLLEGTEKYFGGYENSCYGFRDFSRLHRVCNRCKQELGKQHGRCGSYDTYAKGQTRFYAFPVKKREDGYYACRFGSWEKLAGENYALPNLPTAIAEKLASQWSLPARLELER